MCGIAGRFNYDPLRPVDRQVLESMTEVIAHRGPDAAGYHVAPGIGLGHRRLSIIDLSTGDQPLCNEDGTIWTVFNGEIYNFADVRAELTAHGHRFRTGSDTEVIVHGYEEWGEGCVERFRGMFAFAIWDGRSRRLVLCRDRLGVKPLYYAELPGRGVVFGSELKSLVEDPDVSRDWRPDAIDAYLSLLYIPAPMTVYRGVHKLPPAHVLVAEKGSVRTFRYWDLTFQGDGDPSREDEYLERLEALLRESVALRQISDVPLGAFLSGGIDSTAVASYMVDTSPRPPITIAVGFDHAEYDELSHARIVAEHLGCEFHERTVTPDVAALLPKLAWHFDEPFADSSAVPTYYVSKAARELVTVALSGDGGDELWAGYARHRVERWEHRVRGALGPARAAAGLLGRALPLSVKGARALRHLAYRPEQAYALKHAYGMFEPGAKPRLYSKDFAAETADADAFASFREIYQRCSSADPVDRALYTDVHTYMVDDILTKVDRMSMAVSLEAREPLLDHRLLEFAASVPASLKLRDGRTKYLLRKAIGRRVPAAILERGKHGFEAPIGEWLRGPLAPLADGLLADGRLRSRGVFDDGEVTRLWTEHRTGRADHRHRLWQLIMLELWFRQFIDRAPAERTRFAEAI
ncbi:MAG TPA: asparagine synthase (glutamine-hydrolyzing) [Vicinamibacterales bacterium]|jgi:asparagine synthase (glutamine-hydrolysing)|nr:asparagine synthase (glutamine-hydrolyzing) [Vicinamibacterales bacterium]